MLADIRSQKLHVSHNRIIRLSTFDRTSQGMMNLLPLIERTMKMQIPLHPCSRFGGYGVDAHGNCHQLYSPLWRSLPCSCAGQLKIESDEKIQARRKQLTQAEKRIAELDRLFVKIYEDNAKEKLSDERFSMMSGNYVGVPDKSSGKCQQKIGIATMVQDLFR